MDLLLTLLAYGLIAAGCVIGFSMLLMPVYLWLIWHDYTAEVAEILQDLAEDSETSETLKS